LSKWYKQTSLTFENDLALLNDNEIHIWVNYLNVHEARIKHLYPLLSNQEKERSERFKFYKHRKAFIASHGFMHSVLAYYIDCAAKDIEFSHGEFGKPSLIPAQNPNKIQFNLSHSNNLAMLAICKNKSVGIDVEYAERKTDWMGVSKRFFTEDEQQKLFSLKVNEQKNAFFQIWTRKEAHMKVTAKGLSLAPTEFEVSVPPTAAEFMGYINKADKLQYKMQDILLPDMFKDYYSSLSANFNFTNLTQFVLS